MLSALLCTGASSGKDGAARRAASLEGTRAHSSSGEEADTADSAAAAIAVAAQFRRQLPHLAPCPCSCRSSSSSSSR